jgi:site-specific DNA-methyltransferase (adenine-specific)
MSEIKLLNIECMEYMKTIPDKFFDLAIVDPPYGIGASDYKRGGTQHGNSAAICKTYAKKDWDNSIPNETYFIEIRRISKNQIIWGANHFGNLPPASCWIVWDKMTAPGSRYADCELAWTSFKTAVRQCRIQWSGMLQYDMKNKEDRIHPTQKPIALYKWLLKNYAKEGDKIFDSHTGSFSIGIACHDYNFDLTACEIDKDYYEAAMKRFNNHKAQIKMFA